MDPAVGTAVWAVAGGVAAVLLVALAVTATLLVVRRSDGSRTPPARTESDTENEVETLRARVDELTEELRRNRAAVLPASEFVITTAGEERPHHADRTRVTDAAVLSATLGEPLVKAAAWTYGVRRALSPENRNRIAFEMRREVKRARKERRREARRAARAPKTAGDAEESAA